MKKALASKLHDLLKLKMNPEAAKPRVNGSMLAKQIGCYVCLVGKNAGVGVAV